MRLEYLGKHIGQRRIDQPGFPGKARFPLLEVQQDRKYRFTQAGNQIQGGQFFVTVQIRVRFQQIYHTAGLDGLLFPQECSAKAGGVSQLLVRAYLLYGNTYSVVDVRIGSGLDDIVHAAELQRLLRILEFRMRGEEDHPGIHAALPHPRK